MDESKVKNEEPKVLLTQGEDSKLKAIAGEQDDKLKTVNPTKENADQFMKIDTKATRWRISSRNLRHSSNIPHIRPLVIGETGGWRQNRYPSQTGAARF